MRIALVGPFAFFPKGTVPVRMLPIAKELQAMGHVVTVVLPPYDNEEHSGRVFRLEGVEFQNVVVPKGGLPVQYLVVAYALVRRVLRFRPDIVHIFKPKGYSGLAGMFLVVLRFFRLTGVYVVVDTDDLEGRGGFADLFAEKGEYPGWMVGFFGFQERWLLKRADAVTAASVFLRDMVCGLREKEQCSGVFYVPNGPSPLPVSLSKSSIDVRRKLGLVGKQVVLLYTRFFEYRVEEVLDVLERVVTVLGDDVRLLVVGKGKYGEEEDLLRIAVERGLRDFIVYVGWVEPSEVRSYVEVGEVAIYPFMDTLLNRAKCPGKVVQLMSLGKAIVADGVGQIAEYIEDGKSGLLVKPGDVQGFTGRVVLLLNDEELRLRLGAEAKRRINDVFSWELLAGKVQEAYYSLAQKRP